MAKEPDVKSRYEEVVVRIGTTNSREEVVKEVRRALGLIFFDVEVKSSP